MDDGAARFEFRLPVERRRELAALASKSGLSSSDLVRLSVCQLLENPGLLLRLSLRLDDQRKGDR
jgi:hypothetical protein